MLNGSQERETEVDGAAEMTKDTVREKEMKMSIAAASVFPGFRFSPTDEELISYYLKKKLEGSQRCVEVIAEVEINKFEPWDLPAKSVIQSENEWFFFSPRGRKYPNGSQSKRATESGYWKATGKERNVKSGSNVIGTKRTLVFHTGRAPKGERTEWIMHEYSMSGRSQESLVICRLRRNSDFRLSDSPRQNSSTQSHLSAESLFGNGTEPAGLVERTKAVESSSKEHSDGYSSHSLEQLDSGYESEQRPRNEVSQVGSSSQQDDEYEECYADILKDDIVDLGKPLLPPTPNLYPVVVDKNIDGRRWQQPIQGPGLLPPLQGTAYRRIRLDWTSQNEVVEIESRNENHVEEFMHPKDPPPATCVVSVLSHRTVRVQAIYIVSTLLIMLVFYVSNYGVPSRIKTFMRIS